MYPSMTSLTVRFIHHIQELVYLLIDPLINAYAEVAQTTVPAEDAIMDMVVTEEVVDWLELPHHMVELIMNKLMTPTEISDYVRCGAVCTSWRTVFIHHHHPPPGTRPVSLTPFLMVPTPSSSTPCSSNKNKKNGRLNTYTTNTKSVSFYNVIDKKVYNKFQVTIPSNRYFRGSSHGWLVAVDQNYNNCQVRLFNPFLSPRNEGSKVRLFNPFLSPRNEGEILLPSLRDTSIVIDETGYVHGHNSPSCYVYLRKAVLSADPLSNPIDYYIVMAILGLTGKLAYCRAGGGGCHDKAWTLVEFEYRDQRGFIDVIYCKGKFYALYEPGIVVIIDPTQNMMAVTFEIPPPTSRLFEYDTIYLVELAGYLFQVFREIEVGVRDNVTKRVPYSTSKFRVFRLEEKTKKGKKISYDIEKMSYHNHKEQQKEEDGAFEWELVNDLGGSTLFLGDNHSIWVRASDYPGCKPNSIYFTDDYTQMYHRNKWNGPHDLGVFNLVDDTIENHYPTDHSTPIWPATIWIKPTVRSGIDLDSTYCTSQYRFGLNLLYKFIRS